MQKKIYETTRNVNHNKQDSFVSLQQKYSRPILGYLLLGIIFLVQLSAIAQEQVLQTGPRDYSLYKIISFENDTTNVATTLNISEYHRFNFRREDDFEALPFHNQGQTFNKLGVDFKNQTLFPLMGFRAKHYDVKRSSNVNYYKVATPTTELMYRTGMGQGQVLDAFVTLNTSRNFNLTFGYKGLDSFGKYRNSEVENSNFTSSFNFQTQNQRYRARGYFSSYDYFNEENGGLTAISLELFKDADEDFFRRSRLDVNHDDASSSLDGNNVFFEHQFSLNNRSTQKTKTTKANKLQVGHTIEYETKHYRFNKASESNSSSLYGPILTNSIQDHTHYRRLENRLFLQSEQQKLGKIQVDVGLISYDYHYNSQVSIGGNTIPENLKGDYYDIKAIWKTEWKDFAKIKAEAAQVLDGDFRGSEFSLSGKINAKNLDNLEFFASYLDHSPNLNLILHQSGYEDFNWFNNLKNKKINMLGLNLAKKHFGSLETIFSSVKNYTYFNESVLPEQASETLNYLKLKYNLPINYKKYTLESDLQYQHVFDSGDDFFRVPDLLIRSSFFYSDYVFKGDPMFLQTGFTAKYFTKFHANAYNPIISEFYLQNTDKIGNFVLLDFFANAKVREARLFLKAENILAPLMSKRSYFAAPLHPYRDLTIRFGVIWSFFM